MKKLKVDKYGNIQHMTPKSKALGKKMGKEKKVYTTSKRQLLESENPSWKDEIHDLKKK